MEFRYKAKTQTGHTQTGIYPADTEEKVIDFLRQNGWIPVDIKVSDSKFKTFKSLFQSFKERISVRDKSIFYRHLSLMLASGIPIEKSLLILHEEERKRKFKNIIQHILASVRNGASVAAALETLSCFSSLEIAIIKAGEEAGLLDAALQRLSEILDRQDSLRKKVIAASIYPLLVLFVAISVLLLVTVFVLPQFENTFYQMNIPMPAFSATVFAVGKFLRTYGFIIPLLLIFLITLLLYLKRRSKAFEIKYDKVKLKLPVIGNIVLKAALSRSFRTLGLMLESGVSLLPALHFSGEVADNTVIKNDFDKMINAAKTGKSLYNTLNSNSMYPAIVVQIIKIGEETGRADDKFIELAGIFENDMDDTISRLSSILEPVLVMIVGILVAIMLFAVYLPILDAVRNFI